MGIFKRLFSRKKKSAEDKTDDPGYLACPVVAAELKRGKFDSPADEEPSVPESESAQDKGDPPKNS